MNRNYSDSQWRQLRAEARKNFGGSTELFDACWRRVAGNWREGYYDCDLGEVLDQAAAELVNDPSSRFFIYG